MVSHSIVFSCTPTEQAASRSIIEYLTFEFHIQRMETKFKANKADDETELT